MNELTKVWLVLFIGLSMVSIETAVAQERRTRCLPGKEMWPMNEGRPRFNLGVSPEEEREVLEFFKRNQPEEFEMLMDMKEAEPLTFQRELMERVKYWRHLKGLEKKDPGRYEKAIKEMELDYRSRQLARSYRETKDSAEKKKVEKELKNVLDLPIQDMMRISDLVTADPDASVTEISKMMTRKQVPSVVLVKNNKPVGLITIRDMLRFFVTQG